MSKKMNFSYVKNEFQTLISKSIPFHILQISLECQKIRFRFNSAILHASLFSLILSIVQIINSYIMKKMFTIKVYALSMAAMAFISSCQKETKEEPQTSKPKTQLELLMGANWLEVDARDANGSLWDQVKDCVKDDLLMFRDAGLYEYNTGTLKCDPSEKQVMPGNGTWELSADAGTLKMGPYSYRVEELTDSKLRLFMSGQGYQLTVFYEKR